MNCPLDFETPLFELTQKVLSLRNQSMALDLSQEDAKLQYNDIIEEICALELKMEELTQETYANLSIWQRVQLSRHPDRPHAKEFIYELCPDFHELHGDRCFSDDAAIIGGIGTFKDIPIVIIGIEKGQNTNDKIHHNFGMPKPDGYRKALRLMKLADQFNLPIITLIDTPGAYPGIQAEERGQGQAIAENIAQMFDIKSPIMAIVIGEGGSGGALALAIADKVFMLEYSIYSVISPESCASILWSDASKAQLAANALALYPQKALDLQVIDAIIPEPFGGAHRNHAQCFNILKEFLNIELEKLLQLKSEELIQTRFEKFRKMGNQTIITRE